MKLKIKVGDEVQVISGSEKGRKGSVLEITEAPPSKIKIRVKDVRLQTCFDKKEGINKKEGLIDYSNVKLIKSAPAKSFKKTKKTAKKGLFQR